MQDRIRTLIQNGLQAQQQGNFQAALGFFRQALQLAQQLNDSQLIAQIHSLIQSAETQINLQDLRKRPEKTEEVAFGDVSGVGQDESILQRIIEETSASQAAAGIIIDRISEGVELKETLEYEPEEEEADEEPRMPPPPSLPSLGRPAAGPPATPPKGEKPPDLSTPMKPPAASIPPPSAGPPPSPPAFRQPAPPSPAPSPIAAQPKPQSKKKRGRKTSAEERERGEPDTGEQAPPKKIKRYGDVTAPMEMTEKKEYLVNVGLRMFKEDVKGVPVPMQITVPVSGPPILEILVIGRDFKVDQPRRTLLVPLDRDSDILNYRVTPKRPGIGNLTVEFYQEGTLIGRAILKIVVKKKKEPVSEGTSSTSVVVSSPAEMKLDATLRIVRYEEDFFFSLFTPRAKAVVSQSALFGKASVNMAKVKKLEGQIENALFDQNHRAALEKLKNLGAQIYNSIPKTIRSTIQSIDAKYLMIETGDLLVPWELAFDGSDFLCSKYCLGKRVFDETRDFRPPPFCIGKKILDVIFIGASPTGVPEISVEKELELFDTYDQTKRIKLQKLVEPNAAKAKVLESLINADLIHLTCHGKFEEEIPTESALLLSDDVLTAKEIDALAITKWPLIFANACSTGAISDKIVGIGGIARSFLEAGAIAFLGPLFEIPDDIAVEFAKEFYNNLLFNDENLGEAILNTRQKLREQFGGAFWAIFSLYGDPTLSLCKA
jgi:CHAT domain-containing protein